MITVLSGSNTHAVREELARLRQAFISQYGTHGVELISGEQLEPANLSSLLGGATLFATNRLVVIKDLSENKPAAEKFLEVFKQIPDEVGVVLAEGSLDKRTAFYKTLKKEVDFYEFAALDEAEAIKWVSQFVPKEGGKITHADARLLVQYAGTDQSRLTNELTKLLAYNSVVSKDSIEELVEKNPEETIFQLLEYALSGKPAQALSVLGSLERSHEDPFQAANMLIWQTNTLAVVASAGGTSDSEVAKDTKLNPYVVKKTRGLAARLSKEKLNQIIDAVAQLDVRLKTTSANPWRTLEGTLLKF